MKRQPIPILWALLATIAILAAGCGSGGDTPTADTLTPTSRDQSSDTSSPEESQSDNYDAASDPIVIGALTSLSGPFTPWGVQLRDGMLMAAEDINAEGGVHGRPIEIVVYDDQSNAEEATKGIERLIDEGVAAIAGPISSDVGLATSVIAEEVGTPLFLTKAGSDAILTQESRFTFRTCIPAAPMVAAPIAQYAQAQELTKVGAIIADYGWGQSIKAALETEFAALDGVELQIEVAPVGEQDFTTYLRKLQEFEPELLVATGHPPGSGTITAQAGELGIDVPVTGAYSSLSSVMNAVGDEAVGRYADFGCADYDSAEYQELAARFVASTDNTFMEDDAVAGYGVVTAVADAVKNVGDERNDIAAFLHGATYDLPGYAFKMAWTEWGELANAQPLFVVVEKGPAPEGTNGDGEWYPELLIKPEPLTPYEPTTEEP